MEEEHSGTGAAGFKTVVCKTAGGLMASSRKKNAPAPGRSGEVKFTCPAVQFSVTLLKVIPGPSYPVNPLPALGQKVEEEGVEAGPSSSNPKIGVVPPSILIEETATELLF